MELDPTITYENGMPFIQLRQVRLPTRRPTLQSVSLWKEVQYFYGNTPDSIDPLRFTLRDRHMIGIFTQIFQEWDDEFIMSDVVV